MSRYINPFTDWGFKRLFGQEFSKDLLISFLNDLFEGEFHIQDVTFKDKEQLADTKDLRGCIYDVFCETDDGKHFIVEMQNNRTVNFVNRTLCYASKAITSQREKEKTKDEPTFYELVPVYVVSFMNFLPHAEDEVSEFKTDVMLREKGSEEAFMDKLRFIYLNLPFFKKKAEECVTDFEKWIYVLKHMATLERIPFETQKKIFKRLAEVADSRCLSKEEMEKYEEIQRQVTSYNLGMYSAWQEGNQKGKLEEKLENAKRLLALGVMPKMVADGAPLPLDEVLSLVSKA